ncbi:MAG TPA: hypothetical protein VGR26_11610 [Acidimicrobiales bacterium]|nr:hypothetical protein [Acidimicrobiales bacterium]
MAVTHSVVLYDPTETKAEVKAAAGFLAGYSGRTREAYTLDLRQFYGWCDKHPQAARGDAHAHRALRPRAGGARPGAGDDRPGVCRRWRASTATQPRRA